MAETTHDGQERVIRAQPIIIQQPIPSYAIHTTNIKTLPPETVVVHATHLAPYCDGPRPNDYCFLAFFSLLFCCCPLGLLAVIYSFGVDEHYMGGDLEGSQEASKKARICIILAFTFGIFLYVFNMSYFTYYYN
mmetsp:Transcript_14563/g.18289  ORF Transcript_14563/g.18289 Transcript_14563/m.18289 type:complete len:134 (-) Transcript_14563:18-419(-)